MSRETLLLILTSVSHMPIRHAARFAVLVAAGATLLLWPALRHHHGDLSVFIVAGDKFVHPVPSLAIYIRQHSTGYDGQFYYGMALDPAKLSAAIGSVTFDHPAWRWQRILYPLLANLLAFGWPRLIPASLFAINIAAFGALAILIAQLSRKSPTAGLQAWMFVLWPGFLISLSHDTTELLACALLFGALLAYLRRRHLVFAAMAAAAALTRETCSLMLAGIALTELLLLVARLRHANTRDHPAPMKVAMKPALSATAALLPFLLWHVVLADHWRGTVQSTPLQANIGLPLVGVAQRLAASTAGMLSTANLSFMQRISSAYDLAVILFILCFSTWVLKSLPSLFCNSRNTAALATGWLAMMLLISLLSARGPWIDSTAILRAYSECWVVGCILLGVDARPLPPLAMLGLLPIAWLNWTLCLVQLR